MFSHLHAHSWFSLGQGASSPGDLIAAAAARGLPALACTDTNGVYGAVEFQRAAIEAGIRPILGAHLVLGDEECVALAMDERGWGAVCRAITNIHWQQRERSTVNGQRECRSPAVQPSSRPVTCLSALLAHDRDGAIILSSSIPFLERIVSHSGPADIFAELVPGKERHAVLAAGRRLGLLPVVTNAVMFAHPEDHPRHRLLSAIAANTTLSGLEIASGPSGPRDDYQPSSSGSWLKTEPDLSRHFPDVPDAIDRAGELAERCRYLIPIGERVVPPRYVEATDALQQLRALAYQGAARRYGTIAPITRDRLEHELAIIGMKGFADYFLVVKDIVEHGPTHCGRGSVANSIVSYCLGITHVEPLGAGLLFERFLNPERKDPPDIDLDFPWDERDHILAWVFRRYPMPRAAMVANHNTLKLRGALREVAKVDGRPPAEIREVTRRIPWYSDEVPIDQLLAEHPNFTGLDLPAAWQGIARRASALVGTPRHLSLHPGGVVIVPGALTDFVPVEPAAKRLDGAPDLTVPVIQFEKDGAEDAGLVKIDLLGNRSLAVIRDGIAAVRAHTGRQLDYTSAEAGEDPETRKLFRTGNTMGVFYTESPASRALCIKSKAEDYEILVLNTSIIRPASNRFIRIYLERLHGGAWEPLDPSLRDVLSETFGVMVYQEDVVNVCSVFAGMPLATGDGLRKALSKKRPAKALASYAEEFFTGALALGRRVEIAKEVWHMVMSFAGYSFCKGHSCSYIQVAQQSGYLRAHYPAEFFAAVLANGGGFYAPFAYVAEARRAGLTVLPPDVNASEFRTTGHGGEIRIGLQFVKGLSAGASEGILEGRKDATTQRCNDEAPYLNIEDLRERARLKPDDLRLLIKVGACDSIAEGRTRPEMLWEMDAKARGREDAEELQLASSRLRDSASPRLPEYSADRRRREEYELLTFATDCHPMELRREDLRRFRLVPATRLAEHVGRQILAAGMLTTAKPVHTAHDEPMQFATFDDGHGLIETVLFPEIHRTRGHVLFDQGPFIFRGKVEEEFGAVSVTVTHLDRLDRMLNKVKRQ
ncbi:MAG TPA: DNA polymerase III subunit alpha [Gemmatimonadales bacterium]|nr:DNA polymerase III subunit alpha [Gemmatimonadales bacterium]